MVKGIRTMCVEKALSKPKLQITWSWFVPGFSHDAESYFSMRE